jgi:hypothetical protein
LKTASPPALRASKTCQKSVQLNKKEANTTPDPIIPINALGRNLCPKPLIKNPIKGIKGINQISSIILGFIYNLPT